MAVPTILASYLPRASQRAQIGLPAWAFSALAVACGSAVIAVSAQIAVPGFPVPMTMQSLAVLAVGIALGTRLGVAAVLLYLAEGASGLPVFANWSGTLAHLTGPTGGYLVSFVPAAWLAGRLVQAGWSKGIVRPFLAYTLGHALILASGGAYLSLFIGAPRALAVGVAPFIAGSLVKSLLGATLGKAVSRLRPLDGQR
jgi:biotin transport system substrate-specific component